MCDLAKEKFLGRYLSNHLHGNLPKLRFSAYSIQKSSKILILNCSTTMRRFFIAIWNVINTDKTNFTVRNICEYFIKASKFEIMDKWDFDPDNQVIVENPKVFNQSQTDESERIALVIFGFNRPEKLKSLLESLLLDVEEHRFDFFAYIDGPRIESERIKTQESAVIAKKLLPQVRKYSKALTTKACVHQF